MSEQYVELYKKYRPRVFSDMIGQDAIVEPLRKTVLSKKIPTGFLFSGPAGTGKTTAALIFAKAINCENLREDGNPCNECATCKAIDNNSQPGIKYVSMANNGGVDEVRKIMEESRISQPVNRKVFILDEIHNASGAAMDSMLIELENEQQSTVFICCTTDPDKIKPAILSRLQQRTFRSLSAKELTENLISICKKEPDITEKIKSKEITKEQIIQCALSAGGSVRTSISNLETLIANGILPTEYTLDLLKAILSGDPIKVYDVTNKASQDAVNFNKMAEQLYNYLVEMLKHKAGAEIKNEQLKDDIITKVNGPTILKFIKELSETLKLVSNKVIDYKILYEICYTNLALIYRKQGGN